MKVMGSSRLPQKGLAPSSVDSLAYEEWACVCGEPSTSLPTHEARVKTRLLGQPGKENKDTRWEIAGERMSQWNLVRRRKHAGSP